MKKVIRRPYIIVRNLIDGQNYLIAPNGFVLGKENSAAATIDAAPMDTVVVLLSETTEYKDAVGHFTIVGRSLDCWIFAFYIDGDTAAPESTSVRKFANLRNALEYAKIFNITWLNAMQKIPQSAIKKLATDDKVKV